MLRTSGLLSRSNKVMYDLRTRSVIDTFTGRALSGPCRRPGWCSSRRRWSRAPGETGSGRTRRRIVAEDGGIGREYDDDPLAGRDDDGPIFPIGDVDPRLPIQAPVVGVVAQAAARGVRRRPGRAPRCATESVAAAGVELVADGGGLRARSRRRELPAHQAFWFAWSQFHPDTALWTPLG